MRRAPIRITVAALLLFALTLTLAPARAAQDGANAARGALSGDRKIKTVLLAQRWNIGYGGMQVLDYYPIVLYADGAFTRDTARAVSGDARLDGKWRDDGGVPVLSGPDGKPVATSGRLSMSQAGRAARPKQTLSGSYGSFSGLGGGGTGVTGVVAWSHYEFAADGTVRMRRGSGSSTGTGAGSSKAGVVTRSTASDTARYSLDGYTITFTSADGSSRKLLFYFMGSKDDMIVVGGRKLSKK
jgi:hypothetical protein